jgi:fucose 4-O-acetylase-like acetyltransferase
MAETVLQVRQVVVAVLAASVRTPLREMVETVAQAHHHLLQVQQLVVLAAVAVLETVRKAQHQMVAVQAQAQQVAQVRQTQAAVVVAVGLSMAATAAQVSLSCE